MELYSILKWWITISTNHLLNIIYFRRYNIISKNIYKIINQQLCIALSILKSMLRTNQIKSINHGYTFAIISIDESMIYNWIQYKIAYITKRRK